MRSIFEVLKTRQIAVAMEWRKLFYLRYEDCEGIQRIQTVEYQRLLFTVWLSIRSLAGKWHVPFVTAWYAFCCLAVGTRYSGQPILTILRLAELFQFCDHLTWFPSEFLICCNSERINQIREVYCVVTYDNCVMCLFTRVPLVCLFTRVH